MRNKIRKGEPMFYDKSERISKLYLGSMFYDKSERISALYPEFLRDEPKDGGQSVCDIFRPKKKSSRLGVGSKRKPVVVGIPVESLIVIDGSNVIGSDAELRVKILSAIIQALERMGYQYKVFVDKSIFGWLRKIQDEEGLQYISEGVKQGVIIVAPSKAEADGQILQLAEFEKEVHIITNDRYRDYVEIHPWLADRCASNRLHGINLVYVNGRMRVLIAGFNLDIAV